MEYWDNDKIHLESEVNKPVSFLFFFNIPIFQHSITPCMKQNLSLDKSLYFSRLGGIEITRR